MDIWQGWRTSSLSADPARSRNTPGTVYTKLLARTGRRTGSHWAGPRGPGGPSPACDRLLGDRRWPRPGLGVPSLPGLRRPTADWPPSPADARFSTAPMVTTADRQWRTGNQHRDPCCRSDRTDRTWPGREQSSARMLPPICHSGSPPLNGNGRMPTSHANVKFIFRWGIEV